MLLLLMSVQLSRPIKSVGQIEVSASIFALSCSGIGIIHNNMGVSQQVEQVRKTKRFENGFITEPFVLKPTDTINDVDCIKKVRRTVQRVSGISRGSISAFQDNWGATCHRDAGRRVKV